MTNYYNNYKNIKNDIDEYASKISRDPDSIKILAVSKTFPHTTVQNAIDSGITLFGESKIQEAKSKIPLLAGNFEFHMIGHLQSNKAKDAVNLFSMIHSLSSITTAEKINREAFKLGKIQDLLIQINSSGEETKSGIDPAQSVDLAGAVSEMKNLNLKGIMTIGPLTDDESEIHKAFALTRRTLENINKELKLSLKEISMGMSNDFLIAVEEGATIIRIGSAIFGSR